ncbi:periplasmic trehalase [Escherichia coli]|uniref:Periplasmic trehalase n=1 Tax=Escherichia coli TaxID=562 RepID=A0A377D2T0_ECOLX|nr:periplasmic trehalase [Escherichia coli]
MVELLAQHEGDAALKQYLPQMQKEYAYWMDGVENLQAGQQEKRVVKLQDGTLLNRYWDDRDTPTTRVMGGRYCHRQKQSESTCH